MDGALGQRLMGLQDGVTTRTFVRTELVNRITAVQPQLRYTMTHELHTQFHYVNMHMHMHMQRSMQRNAVLLYRS